MTFKPSRRQTIRQLGTAAIIPLALIGTSVHAKKVDTLRTALKYQPDPKGEAQCSNCLHYQGETTKGSQGLCAIIPGDTEIDATGWCAGYVKRPA